MKSTLALLGLSATYVFTATGNARANIQEHIIEDFLSRVFESRDYICAKNNRTAVLTSNMRNGHTLEMIDDGKVVFDIEGLSTRADLITYANNFCNRVDDAPSLRSMKETGWPIGTYYECTGNKGITASVSFALANIDDITKLHIAKEATLTINGKQSLHKLSYPDAKDAAFFACLRNEKF